MRARKHNLIRGKIILCMCGKKRMYKAVKRLFDDIMISSFPASSLSPAASQKRGQTWHSQISAFLEKEGGLKKKQCECYAVSAFEKENSDKGSHETAPHINCTKIVEQCTVQYGTIVTVLCVLYSTKVTLLSQTR